MAKLRLKETPGTNLLVSMLIRYPELSSLSLNARAGKLTLTILLKGEVADDKCREFALYCTDYFLACRELEPSFAPLGKIGHSLMDGVTILTYEQQVDALHVTELSLFVQLVREFYAGLVGSDLLPLHEAELHAQEEIIAGILGEKETLRQEDSIVAYRDGGKVFVYNK